MASSDDDSSPGGDADFVGRLRQVVASYGGTQAEFAAAVGVSLSGLKKWLSGASEPGRVPLLAIRRVADVSLDWLVSGAGPREQPAETVTTAGNAPIPLFDVAFAAGTGKLLSAEHLKEILAIPRHLIEAARVNPSDVVAVYAHGDSMSPTIKDGEIVLIDTSATEIRSDYAYALRMDGELRIKRLTRRGPGTLLVRSDNPTFRDELVEVKDLADFEVLGRVLSVYNRVV